MALARTFGCARVVYNDALATRRDAWKDGLPYPKATDLQKQVITAAKKTPERAWLASVGVDPLIQSLRDLDTAYRNFFDSVARKREGGRGGGGGAGGGGVGGRGGGGGRLGRRGRGARNVGRAG
ncbi:helix-turn-helix domain-containing protein [Kitasatospora sp. NPDC059088]|uniref:helix-turn-helix domain-containing protein n=1 Tax=Kitasatospora sp. NPDC059088 TaxID=3346722 RepID=UPI0036C5AA34